MFLPVGVGGRGEGGGRAGRRGAAQGGAGRGEAGRGQTLLGSPAPCTTTGRPGRRPSALQDHGPQGGGRAIAAEA